jgi:hypothetical protein
MENKKEKTPYDLKQIQWNCNKEWGNWVESNKNNEMTYFVFRYINTDEYDLQECGIMHKIPSLNQWTQHAYMDITEMLNDSENKDKYVEIITKTMETQLS